MSADNWTICPKCNKKAIDARQELLEKLRSDYGKISQEKYEIALLAAQKPINIEHDLREDYEYHMDIDGSFTASYSARCDKCGFKYKFNHKEQISIS